MSFHAGGGNTLGFFFTINRELNMTSKVNHFPDNKALRDFLGKELYGLVFRGMNDDDALMLAEAGMTITDENLPMIHYAEKDDHQTFLLKLLTNADVQRVLKNQYFHHCLNEHILGVLGNDNRKLVSSAINALMMSGSK